MKTMKKKKVTVELIEKITCDRCGREFTLDEFKCDEGFSFQDTGGFSSRFGDGTLISIDLCADCFYDMMKPYAKLKEPEW